jgi:hypothetical protein
MTSGAVEVKISSFRGPRAFVFAKVDQGHHVQRAMFPTVSSHHMTIAGDSRRPS